MKKTIYLLCLLLSGIACEDKDNPKENKEAKKVELKDTNAGYEWERNQNMAKGDTLRDIAFKEIAVNGKRKCLKTSIEMTRVSSEKTDSCEVQLKIEEVSCRSGLVIGTLLEDIEECLGEAEVDAGVNQNIEAHFKCDDEEYLIKTQYGCGCDVIRGENSIKQGGAVRTRFKSIKRIPTRR